MSRKSSSPPDVPAPLRRFLAQLDAFRAALGKARARTATHGPEALLGHSLYAAGGRTPVFMLQGLARVYRKLDLDAPDTAVFDRLRLESKIIEDELGQIDFWWVVRRLAAEHKLPRPVLAWAEQRHVEASGEANTWLEAREWIAHRYLESPETFEPRADRLERRLRKVDWPNAKRFRRAWADFLSKELRAVDAALDTLDLTDLEAGLHEARRQVRWISVYAAALGGQLVLDHAVPAPEGWDAYLTPEVVGNPYNRLPEPTADDRPLTLPAALFYALSFLIDRLGQLKDRAQWTETFTHGLEATGSAKGRSAASFLGELALDAETAAAEGARLVESVLRRDNLLERMAEAIDRQR